MRSAAMEAVEAALKTAVKESTALKRLAAGLGEDLTPGQAVVLFEHQRAAKLASMEVGVYQDRETSQAFRPSQRKEIDQSSRKGQGLYLFKYTLT